MCYASLAKEAKRLQFVLLEIYGLCSGDARSYEFTEVFHGCLLQVIHMVMLFSLAVLTLGKAFRRCKHLFADKVLLEDDTSEISGQVLSYLVRL